MTYGAEGFLLRSLDGYGTVGTGLGAGTGAGTVQVRYRYGTGTVRVRYMGTVGTVHGYGTWVRFSYPCTVPTVPMYRTRTVPVPYPYPNPYQPSRTYHLAYRPASKMANRALLSKLANLCVNASLCTSFLWVKASLTLCKSFSVQKLAVCKSFCV